MKYYKIVDDNYILAIGTGNGGTEITEAEYNKILSVIQTRPQSTETTDYRLKTNLTWEPYDIEPEPEEDEIDESEALEILLGGSTI